MFRSTLVALAALVASTVLTTCGIETVTTFSQPIFTYSGANNILLTHNPANSDPSLKGYEIYYRVFDAQDKATKALTDVQNFVMSLTATPETCISFLGESGFTRIFDADGNDGAKGLRPLFSTADSISGISIILDAQGNLPSAVVNSDLQPVQNNATVPYWYYTVGSASTVEIGLTRSISQLANAPKSFESSYSPTDQDYAGAGSVSNSTVYLVFFAVAYGLDTSSATAFTPQYSLPTSLYTTFTYQLPATAK